MGNVLLQLGDVTFADLEIPERLAWGGEQSLTVHDLIGGVRVVDAMGRKDAPIAWSGHFMGASAMDRAQYLNTQRILGQPLQLSLGALLFTVVVQSFTASYEYAYHVPYQISCVVVQDQTTPTSLGATPGIDDSMGSDLSLASGLGATINDSTLSGLLGAVGTAIAAVPTFANAAQTTINTVLQPIASAQSRVGVLLGAAITTTQGATALGGLVQNAPLPQLTAALTTQAQAFAAQPPLLSLQNVLGRMTTNLNNLRGTANTITVASGNLMTIASQQYGDPTSWTGIAKANGITDQQLQGVQSLNIPTLPDTLSGGILGG